MLTVLYQEEKSDNRSNSPLIYLDGANPFGLVIRWAPLRGVHENFNSI